jgi:hypothetical protein
MLTPTQVGSIVVITGLHRAIIINLRDTLVTSQALPEL